MANESMNRRGDFRITYSVPYEGDNTICVSTLAEAKVWLENNSSTYDFSLDNVDVFEVATTIDAYSLFRNDP